MMGSFGNAVTSLLDVYTKYLSLLEQHRQNGRSDKSRRKLGSSIRSDRARVRRAYATSLSQQGASFERGDGEGLIVSPYGLENADHRHSTCTNVA